MVTSFNNYLPVITQTGCVTGELLFTVMACDVDAAANPAQIAEMLCT